MSKRYTRRRFLQWGGVGGAVLVAGCAGDETDTPEDEGDTPSTDPTEIDTESETDSEEANRTEIFEQWAFETGDEVYSSPVMADGTVYVGSHDSNVYALSVQ